MIIIIPVFNTMIDAKTLDRFAKIMVDGLTPQSFPVIMAEVYLKVMQTRDLKREDIRNNCIEVLNYIVDNTNSGENDEQLDAVAKQLIPGMVDAFMMIQVPPKCKKFSCLC